MIKSANGLKLLEIKSNVTFSNKEISLDELLNKISRMNNYLSLVFLDYATLVGYNINGKFEFFNKPDFSHLNSIRVFNKEEELYAFKTSNKGFRFRVRKDGEGQSVLAVDAEQIVIGTHSENINDLWSKLTEKRGFELFVPFKVDVSPKERFAIHTRHYIGNNKYSQATYTDFRLIGFKMFGKDGYSEVHDGQK